MNQFFKLYKKAVKKYNLSRSGRLSIFDGCEMKIFRDDLLIIFVKADTQEELYQHAYLSLKNYMRLHEQIERRGEL